MKKVLVVFASLSVFAATGCNDLGKSPSVDQVKGDFSLTSSSDGTFLLNKNSGVVWRYKSDSAFHSIPVVTDDTLLMKLPNGDKKEIPLAQVRDLIRKGATVEKDQGPSDDDLIKALDALPDVPSTTGHKTSDGKPCDKKTDPLCIR